MKKILALIFYVLFFINAYAQNCATPNSKLISLDAGLSDSNTAFEFSSLAKWQDGKQTKILIVPALKREHKRNEIYALDSAAITDYLCGRNTTPLTAIDTIKIECNFISIYNDGNYDGIEATCVVGNTIFFAVETSGPTAPCYILKGRIDASRSIINIEDTVKIAKPQTCNNCPNDRGFESLTFVGGYLYPIFEFSGSKNSTLMYQVDTLFNHSQPLQIIPLNLLPQKRLSEIIIDDDNNFWGINSTYDSNALNCFYYIVSIKPPIIQEIIPIAIRHKSLNWEGMIKFMDGFLLINDNAQGKPTDESKLFFIKYSR